MSEEVKKLQVYLQGHHLDDKFWEKVESTLQELQNKIITDWSAERTVFVKRVAELQEQLADKDEAVRILETINKSFMKIAEDYPRLKEQLAEKEATVKKVQEAFKYSGWTEPHPFDRLRKLIQAKQSECRNEDDRNFWRFVENKFDTIPFEETGLALSEYIRSAIMTWHYLQSNEPHWTEKCYCHELANFCASLPTGRKEKISE